MKLKFYLTALVVLSIFACSKTKRSMNNPLLTGYNTPYESVPFDLLRAEHFSPAFDTAFVKARKEIQAIVDNTETPNFNNTIVVLEASGEFLENLNRILSNLNIAETNPDIQAIARDISSQLAKFNNDVKLNPILFNRVKFVYENLERDELSGEQNALLEKTYRNFIRNGANLSNPDKEEYRDITEELAKLSVQFNEKVLAETNDYILHITDSSDLSGLSEDLITAAGEEAKNRKLEAWVFTLQFPSFMPFMKYADNRELRQEIFMAYNSRGSHDNNNNTYDIIKRITELRLKQANLLGHPTYAAYILDNRMAGTPEQVNRFLDKLTSAYKPIALEETLEIKNYAKRLGAGYEIERWDWNYYSEKLKKEKFNINDEITRPYFKLENVQEGVFMLGKKLYGISFSENIDIPIYHPDVKVFEVYDEDQQFLALLYMDYFPREGKKQGAWMTNYIQQHKTDSKDVRPHVSLVFNFTKPSGEKPSLLTYYEVRTLLHEFGHALHSIFSDVKYSALAGTEVYRDFVELPSQIMENWAEEKEWLDMVAFHYETGERMPEELLMKIIESKNFNSAYLASRQIGYGLTDMAWHSITAPVDESIESFEKLAVSEVELLPAVEGIAMSSAFTHIFAGGYAAGYYGYKWAEVLDADAFSLFKQNGIFDRKTASGFREHILSKGGTEHPMKLYVNFRGQEPSIEPLLERSGIENRSTR